MLWRCIGFAKGTRARNQLNLERSKEKELRSNNGQRTRAMNPSQQDRHGQDPPRSPWTRPYEITMDKTLRDHHGQDPTRSPWTRPS
ncbi:hypothetical protein B0O80DRAFT_437356 [Mortierella sp. GBAus27b]|nr:hypothetical protein B0O80DRAFT_437356 [Mortierella sp. GBAus27b]